MNSNFTKISNEWIIPQVPIECNKLIPIYIYCIILFITAFLSNSLLIILFVKYRSDLMNPTNLLVLALSILNLLGTIFELPIVTISAILCK